MAILIVGRALITIREHLVSLFGFLEFLFSHLGAIALIAVRVILHRHLAIGFFDVFLRSVFSNTEDFVEVAFSHF